MKRIHQTLFGALFAMVASGALASENDEAMKKLASSSGCLTCHGIDAAKPGPKGMAPIGPSWKEVAMQYKGKPGAQDFLTRVVLEGSNPYSSHWKGKVSGLAMPPNAMAIKETDARLLVSWILSLGD